MDPADTIPPKYAQPRRFRRYNLEFPVSLTFADQGRMRELETISKNVSTRGLLLKAANQIPLHTSVNLTMQIKGPAFRRPVRLVGEGEVVRVERLEPEHVFAIAIECKHEIAELENSAGA